MKMKTVLIMVLAIFVITSIAFADFSSVMDNTARAPGSKVTNIDQVAYQKRFDSDSSGRVIYKGISAKDVADADTDWLIIKFTYSDSDYDMIPDTWKTAEGSWDGRAALTYS